MKKRALSILTTLLLVTGIFFAITPVITEAASYPSVFFFGDDEFSDLIIEDEANIGDTVFIRMKWYPAYNNEGYDLVVYDSNGTAVATASNTFTNTADVRNITIKWDTEGLSPGKYDVQVTKKFYSFLRWNEAPTISHLRVNLICYHTDCTESIVKDPTCTEPGTKEYKCNKCGKIFTADIPATGHKWNSDYTVDKEATCTETGSKSIHCSVCGAIKDGSSLVISTDHKWNKEYTIDNEATCTEDGSKSIHCSVCGAVKEGSSVIIPASHDWNNTYTVDTPASYTEEGSESIHCSVCDAIKEGSERAIEKLNPIDKKGADGTEIGEGASAQSAEAAIIKMTNDKDLPGAVFNKLQLKSNKQTKTSISLSWKKVAGAKTYVIYGNKCGNKMKRLAKSTGKSKKITKVLGKKIKKGTYYKFMIVALDKDDNVVSSSMIIHVATKGGKVGNVSKITTKAKKNKVSIKKGKNFKLAGKQLPASKELKVKKHRAIMYESTNPKIAKVTKKGIIQGKKKGTCYVYAYAQNGVFSKIKVIVK